MHSSQNNEAPSYVCWYMCPAGGIGICSTRPGRCWWMDADADATGKKEGAGDGCPVHRKPSYLNGSYLMVDGEGQDQGKLVGRVSIWQPITAHKTLLRSDFSGSVLLYRRTYSRNTARIFGTTARSRLARLASTRLDPVGLLFAFSNPTLATFLAFEFITAPAAVEPGTDIHNLPSDYWVAPENASNASPWLLRALFSSPTDGRQKTRFKRLLPRFTNGPLVCHFAANSRPILPRHRRPWIFLGPDDD
ncbi:hypothetical protein G7046_g7191 [Stylonectria norvegica]|nr:hypothetical protein G7046_g7191 [Stylonectria norvegica]